MPGMLPLTARRSWKALEIHRDDIGERHLRGLFADDPTRGERFTAEAVGIYLDYSKNRITDETITQLVRLAEECGVRQGLAAESLGVQLMKPMPELAALLDKANAKRIFGTKMRSVIKQANEAGISDVVSQQFAIARHIVAAGLVPIVEPEVDIHCPEKAEAEDILKATIRGELEALPADHVVMLKLTLPENDDLYAELVHHPKVVRVVALSGGYTREEGNRRLRRNHGIVASFLRALVEGLSAQQSDAQYNALLDASIQSIFEASKT